MLILAWHPDIILIVDPPNWLPTITHLCPLVPLQRKNGLFKKAYELGVLCSVDVAVIIFGASFPTPALAAL